MSEMNLTPLLDLCQAKVVDQYAIPAIKMVNIIIMPDERYNPICSKCRIVCKSIHSYTDRNIRDMNVFDFKTIITCCYRKLRCPNCGIKVEDIGLSAPGLRVTKRFSEYIAFLCRFMTISDVAKHTALDWKTVKEIHKRYLLQKFANEDLGNPKIIVVDEIAIHKGHSYLTVIIDWDTKKVLWMGKDRKEETLKRFFDQLTLEQKKGIKAVAMDMWRPFINATKMNLPNADIVFDQFHVIKTFSKIIDKVRVAEYTAASKEEKSVMQGSRYILLKNQENLSKSEKVKLEKISAMNINITNIMILKDLLKKIWNYKNPARARKFIDYWCDLAQESGIKYLNSFIRMLRKHEYGMISHCTHPVHTSIIEGFNNKIKVIKRKAYGFNDLEYFILLIKDAFFSN